MKKTILSLLIFFSLKASAQFSQDPADSRVLRYDSAIIIPLTQKFGLDRQAKFMGFSYNLESQQLHIAWQITYMKNGESVEIFGKKSETKFQIADNSTFVNMAGEIITDTTGHPGPLMREIDFYKAIAQRGTGANNATINQLIIQAGSRPGSWKD